MRNWGHFYSGMAKPLFFSLCRPMLVRHINIGPILTENCAFFLPLSHSVLPLPICSVWNFAVKVTVKKLESWGYPPVKTPWSLHESYWYSASVWQTDRRTNGFPVASTALCIASYSYYILYMLTQKLSAEFGFWEINLMISGRQKWHGNQTLFCAIYNSGTEFAAPAI